MNNDRRKQIRKVINSVDQIKAELDVLASDEERGKLPNDEDRRDKEEAWVSIIDDLHSDLDSVKDDEDEYRENVPESLQGGDRYVDSESCSEAMESALEILDELREAEDNKFGTLFQEKYDELNNYLEDATA